MIKTFEFIDKFLKKLELLIISVSLFLLIGLSFMQVFNRTLFSTGISNIETLTRYLVLLIGFFGASMATSEKRHLNIEIFTKFASPNLKKFTALILSFLATLISSLIFFSACRFVHMEFQTPLTSMSEKAYSYLLFVFPVSFGLIFLRFLFQFFTSLNFKEKG